jgi:hypothetical protein
MWQASGADTAPRVVTAAPLPLNDGIEVDDVNGDGLAHVASCPLPENDIPQMTRKSAVLLHTPVNRFERLGLASPAPRIGVDMLGELLRSGVWWLMVSATTGAGCVLDPMWDDTSARRWGDDASRSVGRDAGRAAADASNPDSQDSGSEAAEAPYPDGAEAGGAVADANPEQPDAAGGAADASHLNDADASGAALDASNLEPPDAGSQAADASHPDAGPAAEVCDGIDNDGNGVIDDVDVAKDGVCDCLKIATLGYPGKWGEENVFESWLAGKTYEGPVSLGARTLTAEVLAPFQVIVVQDVRKGSAGSQGIGHGIGRTYSDAEVSALENWVNRGGGLMTVIGYTTLDISEPSNANMLLAPFGMSYEPVTILNGGQSTVAVSHWAAHAISEGVRRVGVNAGYPVKGGALLAWEPSPGKWDVGRVAEFGSGRVLVWGDEWITYRAQWSTDYQVERFWLNAIQWLTNAGGSQVPTASP